MGRLILHRGEYERLGLRLLALSTLVIIFGLFSCSIVWLVCEEAGSRTFDPLWQSHAWEWDSAHAVDDLPIAVTMVIVSVVGGIATGIHTVRFGGILGFCVMLFNLLPIYIESGARHLTDLHASPLVWAAFLSSLLLAFYAGDIGSWICRQRLIREAIEDEVAEECIEDPLSMTSYH